MHVEHDGEIRPEPTRRACRDLSARIVAEPPRTAEHLGRQQRAIDQHELTALHRGPDQLSEHLRFARTVQEQLRLRIEREIATVARNLANPRARAAVVVVMTSSIAVLLPAPSTPSKATMRPPCSARSLMFYNSAVSNK